MQKDAYSLEEISGWVNSNFATLPTVQRGFVWKPSQIENLWDSLLRGFPVGSLVLSQRAFSGEDPCSFDLLDGQQRVTAICLGFGNKSFRQAHDQIKLFIDLDTPKDADTRKFLFRAITKSHPWGYQLRDNTKTLDSGKIREAMEHFDVEDHLDVSLDSFFPFDALFPLPFEFFLRAATQQQDEAELLESLSTWTYWKNVCELWDKRLLSQQTNKKEPPELCTLDKVTERIRAIFSDTKKMIRNCKLPVVYLELSTIIGDLSVESAGEDAGRAGGEAAEDVKTDEVENLFIRLNAGGTPLRGEELNYSILKANIKRNLQKEIEEACSGLFSPARFITIAFRLYQLCKKGNNARDAISLKVKPKQFQRTIVEEIKEFETFLTDLVSNKQYGGETLLNCMRRLLVYAKDKNKHGLPYLTVSRLSSSAPEVVFMLLYRLIKFDKAKSILAPDLHRRVLGMITLFAWLGRGERQRDHAKLLANIWPSVTTLKTEEFWSPLTVQRAMLDQALTPFPTLDNLEKVSKVKPTGNVWDKFESAAKAPAFVRKMFTNRELVLYAQRAVLDEWFEDKHYELDDTNVPFDWDHIFPNKYCHKKRNIPAALRDCYNTNGNFRAWPYSLNRRDQDFLPHVKLNPLCKPEHGDVVQSWKDYFEKRQIHSFDMAKLSDQLLEWSSCDKQWTYEIAGIKKNFNVVFSRILERNVALCSQWYQELKIDSLLPKEIDFSVETIINLNKWTCAGSEDEESDDVSWTHKVSDGRGARYSLFFRYPEVSNDDPSERLREDSWIFGIREEGHTRYLSRVRMKDNYEVDDDEVSGKFTLISHHEDSYCQLFSNFKKWLNEFPDREIARISDTFIKSVITKYQGKVSCLEVR